MNTVNKYAIAFTSAMLMFPAAAVYVAHSVHTTLTSEDVMVAEVECLESEQFSGLANSQALGEFSAKVLASASERAILKRAPK
ncbi:hypothetical protein PN836_005795 [Ningiella sp. W23]|uniref:hypothetical protein n=1 Tax=Ningiella sp. W23 TaxID=3023715 RepID=UPI003756EFFA